MNDPEPPNGQDAKKDKKTSIYFAPGMGKYLKHVAADAETKLNQWILEAIAFRLSALGLKTDWPGVAVPPDSVPKTEQDASVIAHPADRRKSGDPQVPPEVLSAVESGSKDEGRWLQLLLKVLRSRNRTAISAVQQNLEVFAQFVDVWPPDEEAETGSPTAPPVTPPRKGEITIRFAPASDEPGEGLSGSVHGLHAAGPEGGKPERRRVGGQARRGKR